jgi:hypothetical protein
MSSPENPARFSSGRTEILVVCLLLLLRAALTLVPNMWMWGFNTQRFVPPLQAWGLWGLWAASLHPVIGRRLTLAIAHYGAMLRARGSARVLSALALGTLVLWLQDNTWFIGDFLIRRGGGASMTAFSGNYQQSLSLEVFLFDRAPRLMGTFLPVFSTTHRLMGAVSACAIALAAMRFSRSISRSATTLPVGAMIISAGGYLVVATGLGKPAVILCACVALLASIAVVQKPGWNGVAKAGVVAGIAVLLHRGGLLLLPCWAVLIYQTLRGEGGANRPKLLEAIGAGAPILALAAVGPRMWRILVDFDIPHHLAGQSLAGLNQPWTLRHEVLRLLDLANLSYLLVPALPLLVAVVASGVRPGRPGTRLWRLCVLALPWAVALVAIHPQQGVFRDMDVFAAGGVAFACVTGFLTIRLLDRGDLDPRVPAAIALAVVVPTVQILLTNHNSTSGLKRVAAYASETPIREQAELGRTWDFLALRTFVLRDWRGAAAATARAVSYGPSPRLLIMQGISSAYTGDYAGAARAYRQAAQRDTSLAEAWLGLAGVAMYQGNLVLADSAMARVRVFSRDRAARLSLRQMLLSYPEIMPPSHPQRGPR